MEIELMVSGMSRGERSGNLKESARVLARSRLPGVVHGRRSLGDSGWLGLVCVHRKLATGPLLLARSPLFSAPAIEWLPPYRSIDASCVIRFNLETSETLEQE